MTGQAPPRGREPAAAPAAVAAPLAGRPWAEDPADVLSALSVDPERGLSDAETARRRARWGANVLPSARPRRAVEILAAQFKSLIVALLGLAMALSFALGEWIEGAAIGAVLAVNAALGFVAELRAARSMEALRRLGQVDARVRRAGRELRVPADQLVPGDIVLLDEGDVVTADMRLLEANRLVADESALTGESVPVDKSVDAVGDETALAERASMVWKATTIPHGSGMAVVTATGMSTELGNIARLVEGAHEEATPLETRLEKLGRSLIGVTIAVAAAITATGLAAGRDLFLMIETGIALAVAAVPEGLPVVATIALARGMWRMARRRAVINRLPAVETLGATTLILTDKTGTLTENRMTVSRIERPGPTGGPFLDEGDAKPLLVIAALCNNAALGAGRDDPSLGDPLEVALLRAAQDHGIERGELLERLPEVREEAFDPQTRMMATFHRMRNGDDEIRVAVKGAAEAVLEASSRVRANGSDAKLGAKLRSLWLERSETLAAQGLRILALAEKTVADPAAEPYENLTFLGLVGMNDPPRPDVLPALDACRDAGVRVVMVTGDQPETARSIAESVGLAARDGASQVVRGADLEPLDAMSPARRDELLAVPIFARVDPAQKLDLIALHQMAGEVVAMTGDGVNDAPALKKADIGVAMGRRGTQVAKEAADMVLADDAFTSIVAAIEQGRVIFANIRKFVVYLLSCNLSEVMVVGIAAAANVPLPLLPLQILFLNLVTDVFPALALALGEGDARVMTRPPRDPKEAILTPAMWRGIIFYGALITATVLAALGLALEWLELPARQAVTVSFAALALAQLWHVFNMRDRGSTFLGNDITRNPWVWAAIALSGGLIAAAVLFPPLATILRLENPGRSGWLLAVSASLVPWMIGQARASLARS